MEKLLILADDFTGALDTGVQFAVKGVATSVVAGPIYDFAQMNVGIQVLVIDTETRHLPPRQAYGVVFQAVRDALAAGFTYIYKKTDSALRGNIGSELAAVMDAAGTDRLMFLPAFPQLGRMTLDGIQYIKGIPVAESVFGQDPFEPVRCSSVSEIIALQSDKPVVVHTLKDEANVLHSGIQVYDAETDEDMTRICRQAGIDAFRASAGCAGFAAVLADALSWNRDVTVTPTLNSTFLVVCGSVNPVTLEQMRTATAAGFHHIHLNPVQKLDQAWLHSEACRIVVQEWLSVITQKRRCILDANDPDGCSATAEYIQAHDLTAENVRIRIAAQIGELTKQLLDSGLNATILCTGGDTLLALMRAVGIVNLQPVCEIAPGAVLSLFEYQGRDYRIISKSGGFGEPGLFCELASALECPQTVKSETEEMCLC